MSILKSLWAQIYHSDSILMPAVVWIAIPALDHDPLVYNNMFHSNDFQSAADESTSES
jgi:hypothetical protein